MSNVRGLDDILGGGGKGDDEDKKFNDYYAGGEKSGQLLRGAPDEVRLHPSISSTFTFPDRIGCHQEDEEDEDEVDNIFNKVRSAGGVSGTAEDLEQASSTFSGVGRTLAGGVSDARQTSGPAVHRVTFYRNGVFTIDDGPPRQVADPANFPFINSISKVTVNLIRTEEDYQPANSRSEASSAAFAGPGRTLGSSRPAEVSTPAASTFSAPPSREWQGVDEAQPTTALQLRLFDGSRLVARFNHTHTLADVRSFISAARPDITGAYTLATAFPPKALSDNSITLEAAGLLNAVLIQKC